MRTESIETHKKRVLAGIRAMEKRRERDTFKGRLERKPRPMKRIRWDRPLPHEVRP